MRKTLVTRDRDRIIAGLMIKYRQACEQAKAAGYHGPLYVRAEAAMTAYEDAMDIVMGREPG